MDPKSLPNSNSLLEPEGFPKLKDQFNRKRMLSRKGLLNRKSFSKSKSLPKPTMLLTQKGRLNRKNLLHQRQPVKDRVPAELKETSETQEPAKTETPFNPEEPVKAIKAVDDNKRAKVENPGKADKPRKPKKNGQANHPDLGEILNIQVIRTFLRTAVSGLESINSDLETNRNKREELMKEKGSRKSKGAIGKLDKKKKKLKDDQKGLEKKIVGLQGALKKARRALT
jgi:hypothetical protein